MTAALVAVLLGLWGSPPPAAAGDDGGEPSAGAPAPEEAEGEAPSKREKARRAWYKRTLDATHGTLSWGIEGTAKTLDSFFATPEALEEATGSHVKLTYDTSWIEDRGRSQELDVDARLDLPGTEKRFQLVVEGSPEKAATDPDGTAAADAQQDPEEDDDNGLAVAIEGWLEGDRDVRWQIRPALGIKGGLPLNPFTRLRVIRRDQYAKWDSRLSITPAYFWQDGFRFRADKDFDRPLSDRFLFRASSSYGWDHEPDVETFQQTFGLYQTLSPRRRLAYQMGMSANDQPAWGIRQHVARIRYRQRVYQHWLFAEIQPRVRWPGSAHYAPEYGLLFRLDAVFGERSLRRSRNQNGEQ